MEIKHRNNLIRLVVIHLLLLVYPLVSKTIHVHHGKLQHHDISNNLCLENPKEFCPVCDFEFYNFVPSTQQIHFIALRIIPVYNSPAPHIGHNQFVNYFSLRAPPIA